MSEMRSLAIRKLVRWRAFQEALSERESRRAAARVARAQDALDAARASADAVARRREDALSQGAIDLGLLRALGEFEQRAHDEVRDSDEALRRAIEAREEARSAHVNARSRLRVARTRGDREAELERDREEKRLFDRMAALIAVRATENDHD